MKKIFYLMCCLLASFLVSCESNELGGSSENQSVPTIGFSVSANQTVIFSPGNLQYHPVNNKWRFAPYQTNCIGEDNVNISSTYNGWIDLFGWGTGYNPTNTSHDEGFFVDWGVNKIGYDAPNTWRTLTYDEWNYLLKERPNYDKLIGVAQVNGVNGLILLPDNWTCPGGVTFKPGFHDNCAPEYYAEYQTFSASEWSTLETSGAVFLPAAGYYYAGYVMRVQEDGGCWSATAPDWDSKNSCAGSMYISPCVSHVSDYDSRSYARSVRLVRDL